MPGFQWGIVARISDDRRVGAGLGVKRQVGDCRAHIAQIDPAGTIVDVYPDNDTSAYNSRKPRPEYTRALGDITAGRINAVCAWHNDRLHRPDLIELEHFIKLIEEHGTRIATVRAGEIDMSTASGRFMARQLGIVARLESEHKAERIIAKHRELAAAGKSTGGGHRPYGYVRIFDRPERPHRIVREEVVPEEAEIIREAARRVLGGEGLLTVAKELRARGELTSAGKQWSTSSLARMLASARIAGMREHRPRARSSTRRVRTGTITAKGEWPAIITEAESAALRKLLTDTGRRTSPGPNGRYLCSGGVLVCGRCGTNMTGRPRSSGNGKFLYICDSHPGRPGCGHMNIDGQGTDQVVIAWAAGALGTPGTREALMRPPDQPDEASLLEEIARAEQTRKELAEDIGNERITREEWLIAREAVTARIESARARLPKDNAVIILDGLPDTQEGLRAFLADTEVPVGRRRAVIRLALAKVTAHPVPVKGSHRFNPARLEPEWLK